MKLVIGLGNPGEKYKNTRHNVGFLVVDKIVETLKASPNVEKKFESFVFFQYTHQTVFAKPQTFMNESGISVRKLVTQYNIKISNIWVIHDDLDLSLGAYKIQKGKGPKEHNGLLSVYEKLDTKDFWHVRIGVDSRTPDARIKGEDYVLQEFSQKELETVKNITDKVSNELLKILWKK